MQTVQFNIDPVEGVRPSQVRKQTAKVLGCHPSLLGRVVLTQQSLDVRGRYPVYHCVADVYNKEEPDPFPPVVYKDTTADSRAVIVGAGPAGLFAALTLLEYGIRPIILEQGKDVHERKKDIARVNKGQSLDVHSNFCFGEGGAGTFSDGKLFTRSTKRGDVGHVLRTFVAHGAPEEIMSQVHAHIGSDRLPALVEAIRKTIEQHGGEYHFGTEVTDLMVRNGRVYGVKDKQGNTWEGKAVVLATGHSARSLYTLFAEKGWAIEQKGFALGVRVEHSQRWIDSIQYARVAASHRSVLPPAAYSLATQIENRGVFSFCMCPGGMIVPSCTDPNSMVLNGMSNSRRSGAWANAGLVVSVNPEDLSDKSLLYKGDVRDPLALMHWQEAIERSAFMGSFRAPAQRMTDFQRRRISSSLPETTYYPGCVEAPLHALLPPFVSDRLKQAFTFFDKKMRGFYSQEALLLGVESRTSSPVRLPRDKDSLQHVQLKGLYPCGEGAGYAGGIVSSAVDGVNCARALALEK